jgi:hypothetical protein
VLLQVRQPLVDFSVAEVLEEVEALGREHLGGAHAPAVGPTVVSGDGERLVVDLEDFFGGVRGGGSIENKHGLDYESESVAVNLGSVEV